MPRASSGAALDGLGLLLWLKIRHLRTELAYWCFALGTDIVEDRDLSDRIYQIYLLFIVTGMGVAMWWFVLDEVATVFGALGAASVMPTVMLICLAPLVLFVARAIGALRRSPLRLTNADAAYIASGAFGSSAIALAEALPAAVVSALVVGLLAYALAFGMAAAGTQLALVSVAATIGALAAAVVLAAHAAGHVRLSLPVHGVQLVACSLGLGVVCVLVAMLAAGACSAVGWLQLLSACSPCSAAVAAVMVAALLVGLIVSSRRSDLIRAIDESGAYAALYGSRRTALIAPEVYRELRRRYRVSHRRFRPRVPFAAGPAAAICRALVSHLRQYEGLLSLALVGCMLIPAGTFVLTAGVHPVFVALWGYMTFLCAPSIREMALAFREDMRVRLVRDALPISNVGLAVLEGIPAMLAVGALAFAVAGALSSAGVPIFTPERILLIFLLDAAFALAASLEAVELPYARLQPSCSFGVLAVVIASGLCSLAAPQLAIAAACVCMLVFVLVLEKSG